MEEDDDFRYDGESLFAIVNPLDTRRDGCQNLVRNRVQLVGKFGHRKLGTEDNRRVAFLRIGIRNVDHANIHADISDNRAARPVDNDFAHPVAQMTVKTVGIADGKNSHP